MSSFDQLADSIIQMTGPFHSNTWINPFTGAYRVIKVSGNNHGKPFNQNTGISLIDPKNQIYVLNESRHLFQRKPGTMEVVPVFYKGSWFFEPGENQDFPTEMDNHHRVWQFIWGSYLNNGGFGFDVFDKKGNSIRNQLFGSIGPCQLQAYVKDRQGNLWMGTNKGLLLFPASHPGMEILGNRYPELKGEHIANIRLDKNDVLWLGTRGQGLILIDLRTQPFAHISATEGPKGLLNRNFILELFPLENKQLLAKHEFDFTLPYTAINWENLATKIYLPGDIGFYERYRHISSDTFLSPAFKIKLNQFYLQLPENLKKSGAGYGYLRAQKSFYRVGMDTRLTEGAELRPLIDKLQIIQTKYQGDTVWLSTENEGLIAINTKGNIVKKYNISIEKGEGPASQRVHGVCFDAAGNVYAATSAGLSFFDKNTGRFTHYSTGEGLCHPTIYCLTLDRHGNVWCGTGNGLSCFDPATKTFKNYFKSDGLVNSEYNRNSAFTAPNGRVFMGGTEGLDYFVPAEIIQREFNYTPIIGEVSLSNRNLDPSATAFLKTDENNLTFSVTVSDLSRAQTMRYSYLLEGSKRAVWQTIATGNEIQFANLEPGKYELRVKASNLSGKENTSEAQFAFTIAAPWYATIWFTSVCILSGIALIYGVVRNNELRKRRKLERENEVFRLKSEQAAAIAQERERITADLHDDVGATLSSLNIYGDLAHSIWDTNPEKSKEMVGKIAGQSRELMQRMSDIIWSMKTDENGGSGLTPRIRNFAQELLTGKGIVVDMDIDEPNLIAISNPLVRKNIILIIKEALNNVAKYSGATQAGISLRKQENHLILEIRDNGKGFEKDVVAKGNGIENMAARCRQMGGEFDLSSKPGKGTIITCKLPLAIISYQRIK